MARKIRRHSDHQAHRLDQGRLLAPDGTAARARE
jgi:hypothetical protein